MHNINRNVILKHLFFFPKKKRGRPGELSDEVHIVWNYICLDLNVIENNTIRFVANIDFFTVINFICHKNDTIVEKTYYKASTAAVI